MPRPDPRHDAAPRDAAAVFAELPGSVDLPAIEHEVLRRWRDARVFQRSLDQTAGGRPWVFYEGPPTANGMPGVHHIEARVFKDAFPRFKTMQGYHVPRRAGWDCHGLPVEVAVERELGLTAKKDIEAYGIAEFNARCRESVVRHVGAFSEMTERMGYWTDLSTAYWTMDPSYIESVWWSLKQIFGQGLLVKDHRISPYCPRCGTPLSDHEMGQPDVYRTVTDPSVTVRFPLRTLPPGASPELAGADLLVWTTTPWTLVSNVAVAVHPDETYAVARRSGHGDRVVVADALFARVLGEGWHIVKRLRGSELAGATYDPPFALIDIPGAHRVVTASFVTTQDGTGLVHIAPAFGADDMATSREFALPVVNPILPDGKFEEHIPLVGGLSFRDANPALISDLADRGLLLRSLPYEHSYPHCWRCGTALLYYAVPSWFIRTTAIKDRLLAQNEQTNWQPPTIRDGRYGEWLRNNVDWALSRTRYWGTPLPVWICPADHATCVGSLAELSGLAGRDLTALDPHRPYVDDIVIGCPQCGSRARRVPEVIDVWYDSGSMPFAQFGAPWRNEQEFSRSYPAQFVCEAIDQTRGWFYSLMAVGTLVLGRSAYQNAVCLGLIADDRGRKMSKHLGNVVDPDALVERYGADTVRLAVLYAARPQKTLNWSDSAVLRAHRFLNQVWTFSQAHLARTQELAQAAESGSETEMESETIGGDVGLAGGEAEPVRDTTEHLRRKLAQWSEKAVEKTTAEMENLETHSAVRNVMLLFDRIKDFEKRVLARQPELSAADREALDGALVVLVQMLGPFAPHISEELWIAFGHEADIQTPWPGVSSAVPA